MGALPTMRTISNILNRQGYRLRSLAKTQVQKTPETDAIFANIWQVNQRADACSTTLRPSMDTKVLVHVGAHLRHGRSQPIKPIGGRDHDMRPKDKLAPTVF